MNYQHQYVDGTTVHFPLGKVVCIGRNYAEHAKELNNPVPTEPLLFIKPGSCVVPLEGGFVIPEDRGSVHYEAEIAVLIGKPLSKKPDAEEVRDAISGFAPALDLTLRDELTLTEAVGQARQEAMQDEEAGMTISEMEAVARALLRNGQFEEVDEEVPLLLEEFYPETETTEAQSASPPMATEATPARLRPRSSPLTNKLGKGADPSLSRA